jgi:hypothetical protein
MDRQADARKDRWKNRQTDGNTNKQIEIQINEETDKVILTVRQMDGHTDLHTDRWTEKQI